jgi:GNAT superfamily N-acetyltransferase
MTYEVRIAEEQDKEWIEQVAAVRMLTEELNRPELVNPSRIKLLVKKGIDERTCFIAFKDGEPAGVLGAFLIENMFEPSIKVLSEVFWYVLPEYRETRIGFLLLNLFDETARQIANESALSILTGSTEINIDSFAKRGFMLDEFAFNKRY